MIRPNEVPKVQHSIEATQEIAIECYFDEHLKQGTTRIRKTRSGWSLIIIQRVLDKYRANGWRVTDTGGAYEFEAAA